MKNLKTTFSTIPFLTSFGGNTISLGICVNGTISVNINDFPEYLITTLQNTGLLEGMGFFIDHNKR